MKRCPKCNRTFPEETQKFCTVDGGLLITDPTFDPNLTVRATSAELRAQQPQPDRATSRELPDMSETIAVQPNAPTAVFPRTTGPTGAPTDSNLGPAVPQAPAVPQRPPEPVIGATTHHPQPKTKSKLPLILGALAVVFLLGIIGVIAVFFFVVRPRLAELQNRPAVVAPENPPAVEETNTNTAAEHTNTPAIEPEVEAPFVPSADLVKFENSKENLDGKLAEHYVPFSFYYPKSWKTDPSTGAGSFAKVQKTEEDSTGEYLLESASINWYVSSGAFDSDVPVFPDRVKSLESQIAGNYPGYEKVSEGETKVNSLPAYEFRFKGIFKETGRGDLPYWGRVIFIPRGHGEKTGAVITLLATGLASDLSGVEDIGEKGEAPVILESFRFGSN